MQLGIDTRGYDESSVIPAGNYPVVLIDVEERTSKAGNSYLRAAFKVAAGPSAGWQLYVNWNINSQSEAARSITMRQLRMVARGNGVNPDFIQSTEQLIGSKLIAKVVVKEDDFGEKNEISYFKLPRAGERPVQPAPAAPMQTAQPAPAQPSEAAPWD